jgi:hypothetical protein
MSIAFFGEEISKEVVKSASMKKDTRLTFRAPSNLKENLEDIAAREGRSVAQICEAFLRVGISLYGKKGSSLLQKFLGQTERRVPSS